MKRHNLTRLLLLAVVTLLASAVTRTAVAARGDARPTLAFDDIDGDAIMSDGNGAYEGKQTRNADLIVSTGTRSIYFDFSAALTWWSFAPFANGADAGFIDGVTMTLVLLDDTSGTVEFAFKGPDWERGGETDYSLVMSVSVTPSGNGYVLEATSDAELSFLVQESGLRGKGQFYPPYWAPAGVFAMPWGAQVSP